MELAIPDNVPIKYVDEIQTEKVEKAADVKAEVKPAGESEDNATSSTPTLTLSAPAVVALAST